MSATGIFIAHRHPAIRNHAIDIAHGFTRIDGARLDFTLVTIARFAQRLGELAKLGGIFSKAA